MDLPAPVESIQPAAQPPLALTYAHAREPLPPLIRVGGLFGLIGVLLCIALIPIWTENWSLTDIHGTPAPAYRQIAPVIIAMLQTLCFGVGMTLVIVGKFFARISLARAGLRIAIILNLFTCVFVVQTVTKMLQKIQSDISVRNYYRLVNGI